MNHSGDANKMVGEDHLPEIGKMVSDTPRTLQEECYGTCWAACERIEELEAQVKAYANRIKRLEEAGDALFELCDASPIQFELVDQIPQRLKAWEEAKEDKP